jgi:hypothetical protein
VKKSSKIMFLSLLVLTFSLMTILSAAASTNVAPNATVTASSEFNGDYAAVLTIDQQPVQHGVGEWASAGELAPWIELTWPEAVTINKVVVYDRPNLQDLATAGVITFSDGSTVEINDIDPEGKATAVEFEPKTVTSLKIELNGTGANVGLAEIEVFTADAADNGEAPADNPETGDFGAMPYLFMVVLSGLALLAVIYRKRHILEK